MLDFADKTLDQVPFTVPPFVVPTQDFGASMRWNHPFNASIQQIFDEMDCPVNNQSLECEPLQQVLGLGDVVTLASAQVAMQGIPQSIHRHMDFGGESASARSESLLAMFFGTCRTRMGTADRAVNHAMRHIWVICKMNQHPFPHAVITPTAKALKHAVPVAKFTGHHFGSSISRIPRNDGSSPHFSHRHSGLAAESPKFSSIDLHPVSHHS